MGLFDRKRRQEEQDAAAAGPPEPVAATLAAWEAAGRPRAGPVAWPRERWIESFPEHEDVLQSLPDHLSADTARAAMAALPTGVAAAVPALLVSCTWGFGPAKQGAVRTRTILDANPRGAGALSRARDLAAPGGFDAATAGYRLLGTVAKMDRFRADIGTRFLYVINRDALILDPATCDWFNAATGDTLKAHRWVPGLYANYLQAMGGWAAQAGLAPDELVEVVELMAARGGEQPAPA